RDRSAAGGRRLPLPTDGEGQGGPQPAGQLAHPRDLDDRAGRHGAGGAGAGRGAGGQQVIRRIHSRNAWFAAAMIVVAATPPAAARRPPEGAPSSLQEVGNAFEQNRLLAQADRMAALEQTQQSVAQVVRGGLDSDQRTAARFLSGAIAYELGDFSKAVE